MLKFTFIIGFLICCTTIFSQEKDTSFTLCGEGEIYPYYYPELSYKGGFWAVKQHYEKDYPTSQFQKLKKNSGIVTVQFRINCKGETGRFIIKLCDLNYQRVIIDKKILNYFLIKTKTLTNWIPAEDGKGKTTNSHKFFSFRIKGGVLLEILPK
tara:strand:+ start:1036 stop:1497 length:462 start_codon:yes stop_codon:yes gene_type:complete